MIDLSKAKPGDTVHFRCGGSAVIAYVATDNSMMRPLRINFAGYMGECEYNSDGVNKKFHQLLDVIRIEQRPFDWKDVKPGMAFKEKYKGAIWLYSGPSIIKDNDGNYFLHHNGANFQGKTNLSEYQWISFPNMTRAPEHDIEVQS